MATVPVTGEACNR